jgi:hypothetical protein
LDAIAETTVPVSRPVRAIFSASAESTELSAGTGNTTGFAAARPVETDDPPTVKVVVAALAGVATIVAIDIAATTPTAIFLNDFI